jgi:hypothetical protein
LFYTLTRSNTFLSLFIFITIIIIIFILLVGSNVGIKGFAVGDLVGVTGTFVGDLVGTFVGVRVGILVGLAGAFVGDLVGIFVGVRVGLLVGLAGAFVGENVGTTGAFVGLPFPLPVIPLVDIPFPLGDLVPLGFLVCLASITTKSIHIKPITEKKKRDIMVCF